MNKPFVMGIVLTLLGVGLIFSSGAIPLPLSVISTTKTYVPTSYTQVCNYYGTNICLNPNCLYTPANPEIANDGSASLNSPTGGLNTVGPLCDVFYNYSPSIPSGATINSVKVGLNATYSFAIGGPGGVVECPFTLDQSVWTIGAFPLPSTTISGTSPQGYTGIGGSPTIFPSYKNGPPSPGLIQWMNLPYSWTPSNVAPVSLAFSFAAICYQSQGYYSLTPPSIPSISLFGMPIQITYSTTVTTPPLTASFSSVPNPTDVGQIITFTASAGGGFPTYFYTWSFGDGSTIAKNPVATATHSYSTVGNYTVSLTVSDSNNTSLIVTQTESVVLFPSVSFSISPASPAVNQQATFTATVASGIAPYSYSWTFGDGSGATGNPVQHSYLAPLTFQVILTVTDSAGAKVSVSHPVAVGATFVKFTYTSFASAGSKVEFYGNITGAAGPFSVNWIFGDGNTGSSGSAFYTTHTYPSPGNYNVTMSVTDGTGKTYTISNIVGVGTTAYSPSFIQLLGGFTSIGFGIPLMAIGVLRSPKRKK